jgi:hypothetical protein
MALTPEHELDLLQNTWAWGIFSSSQMGVPGTLAFVSRLDTSVGSNADGLTNPPAAPSGNSLASDTGELRWDLTQPTLGRVTIDTSRTKALIGFADNQSVAFSGGLTLQPATTRLGWCTLGTTLTQGEVFTNDSTALIVASGWWENTGQVWTDTNKVSVGNQWGHAPVLTEVVPFTLTLPVGTNHVSVWSLNERGQRQSAVAVAGSASSTTLAVPTNAASIWYEVDVARWVASFDLWRLRYFTADELALPSVSSEAATPDGDRVPNLVKYYLGLPGRTPAAASQLPAGELLQSGDQSYVAMTYNHDKLVSDVDCIAEVSADLIHWSSGPSFTHVDQITDLGALEQIAVRDLTPLSGAPKHFMRLRFQRH